MKSWPAESRIDGHDQNHLQTPEDFRKHARWSGGINGHGGLLSEMVDLLNGAVKVRRGLLVDDDGIRAGLGEPLDEIFRWLDHEMGLDSQASERTQALNGRRAESDIWNKAAVHHVHLESIYSSGFERQHLLSQTRKVRRKYGRRYFGHCSPRVAD